MTDPENAIKDSGQVMRPLLEQPSGFARHQAARSVRQARLLFHCSLVLLAAMACLVASDLLSEQARTPGIGVLVVVGVAVIVTWRRYRRAGQAASQDRGPAP